MNLNKFFLVVLVTLTVGAFSADALKAELQRALPAGQLPDDARLGPLRHLGKNYYPFQKVDSLEAWKERAESLRRQLEVSMGIWPRPTRTPLNAVIHSPVTRDDYTVSRVYFESFPGQFVTGSLYRPKNMSGRLPAVLSPHGHFPEGRFNAYSDEELMQQISIGAERFINGGRHPLQARCVQLARMGCVVFQYDLDGGYADSMQRPEHRQGVRENMNSAEGWGIASPRAELLLQNLMGVQTWNSTRALDFLSGLPDVDSSRIAVTGASGGGTQTFILMALDQRPAAAVPCVMVSTGMQGGCNCENAPYLRVGAGNVDFAALTAPRPMGLTAADDWTVELETKGYPDLVNIYSLYGLDDLPRAVFHTEFKHNYNSVNRTFMYGCVNDFLDLGFEKPILERDYVPLTTEELSVWTDDHPAPSGDQVGEPHEKTMLRWWAEDSQNQLDALKKEPAKFSHFIATAWDVLIGQRLEDVESVEVEEVSSTKLGGYSAKLVLLNRSIGKQQLPAMIINPKSNARAGTVIWLSDEGKAGLFDNTGSPSSAVSKLLDAGFTVVGVDLLYQGEFLANGKALSNQPMHDPYDVETYDKTKPYKYFSGYTYGYNLPLFSQRVQDVLTAIRAIQAQNGQESICLVGQGSEAGAITMAANQQSGSAVAKTVALTDGFRFASVNSFDDPMFLPGAMKYGDLETLASMGGEKFLWLDDSQQSGFEVKIVDWISK